MLTGDLVSAAARSLAPVAGSSRPPMRLALVHDWLDRPMGGAERVLVELARMYPEAPIHTLLFDPARYHPHLAADRVRVSRLQQIPGGLRGNRRPLLPLIPAAVRGWDFSEFDVVLSSSSAFAKNVRVPRPAVHVCYCHTPMRFAWDSWPGYLEDIHAGWPTRLLAPRLLRSIRTWDLAGAKTVDAWLTNSASTAERIRRYYAREALVVYPPVDLSGLRPASGPKDYYLTLGTLTEYKRLHLAIRAAGQTGRRLVVVGSGPDGRRLRKLAGPTVTFTGHVSDAERARYLAGARALVVVNDEDFGIAAVEALASGTPVVAFGRGGLTETIDDGRTGILFSGQDWQALAAAFERLERTEFDPAALAASAHRFEAGRFQNEVREAVEAAFRSAREAR